MFRTNGRGYKKETVRVPAISAAEGRCSALTDSLSEIAVDLSHSAPNVAALFNRAFIMADAANKYPENVQGAFYVDDQCIDCDLCRETAPANFTRNDDGGHSYLYKQPENPDEEKLCKEAMEGCPVEAIGSDGQ